MIKATDSLSEDDRALLLKRLSPTKAPSVRDLLRHTSGYSYGATAVPEITKAHIAAKYGVIGANASARMPG